jgi:hypothetical protein
MLATACTQSTADTQATAMAQTTKMTQATTVTPTAAEIQETHLNSENSCRNTKKKSEYRPFLSDRFQSF